MEIKWKKQKQKRKEREERGIGGPRGKKSSIYFVSVFIFFFLSWLYFTVFFSLPLYRYIHILFFY